MIREPKQEETEPLVALAVSPVIFTFDEAKELLGGVLAEYHAGKLGPGHCVYAYIDESSSQPVGWVYFAPTDKADGVYDLWWIGVRPDCQGRGIGSQLLTFVEDKVRDAGGRMLIIETSSKEGFDAVRQFYAGKGYQACGQIPDFYGNGDDKVIYAKKLG